MLECSKRGLQLLYVNGGRHEINQLLFADDAAPMANLVGKLYRLVSEFGRVCKKNSMVLDFTGVK